MITEALKAAKKRLGQAIMDECEGLSTYEERLNFLKVTENFAGALWRNIESEFWETRSDSLPHCALPPAKEDDLQLDELMLGSSFKYECGCGRWHRIAPEKVVMGVRRPP